MAQHDYVIANQSGSAFRADLNNALSATVTGNSGTSAPSTTYAYMIWNDTTSNQRKIRNSANNAWIVLSTLSGGNVFDDDVTFNGASYNLVWDKSDNALEFADNAKCTFGDSDLSIYHDGFHSYIAETGTGRLHINTSALRVNNAADNEILISAAENGTVDLYYDGAIKCYTTATGFKIHSGSHLHMDDGSKAMFGTSNDLQIYHNGANNIIESVSHPINIRMGGSENAIVCRQNGAAELYYDNSIKMATSSSGITVTGTVTETSDISLKNNINTIQNPLDLIEQIRGINFTWKNNGMKSMGVIAQDVEKVFPELVHGSEGSKSLQYSGLIGALVESVKELSAKLNALEAK